MDARMLMPAIDSLMAMPSYGYRFKFSGTLLKDVKPGKIIKRTKMTAQLS
jgi:predicted ester cyclase